MTMTAEGSGFVPERLGSKRKKRRGLIDMYRLEKIINLLKGGPGSGHFNHPGRPPEVGGSAPSGGGGGGGKSGGSKKPKQRLSGESRKKIQANHAVSIATGVREKIKEGRKADGRDANSRFVSAAGKLEVAAEKIGATKLAERARAAAKIGSRQTPSKPSGGSRQGGKGTPAGLPSSAWGDLDRLVVDILQRAKQIVD